jgi:RNA polymerase-binding transcription factor DksA
MIQGQDEWQAELHELEARWNVFLAKLEQRMSELCQGAIPELRDMFGQDKNSYFSLLNALNGQLKGILDKVNAAYDSQIEPFYEKYQDRLDDNQAQRLEDFNDKCCDDCEAFDARVDAWLEQLASTQQSQLEADYQAIVDEYERIKNSFHCQQCGSVIPLTQRYFITTHLSCPVCRTQNTFEPSGQARGLDFVARELAEERTRHLLAAYEAQKEREESLYLQMHALECQSLTDENAERIAALNQQRKAAAARVPEMYRIYLKAMFDEWIKLAPELEEQNRGIYKRWLEKLD